MHNENTRNVSWQLLESPHDLHEFGKVSMNYIATHIEQPIKKKKSVQEVLFVRLK